MTRQHRASPVRRFGWVAVALLCVGACGTSNDSPETSASKTALTITVTAEEGAKPVAYRLECEPEGGDHPDPQRACAALKGVDPEIFEPVPPRTVCTAIAGGPQTATVAGHWGRKKIDAQFSRSNGCEIGRWDALGSQFFNTPTG